MQIILFLIILSLCVAGGFLVAFFWAVRDGQYDDDVTPSMRILFEDDIVEVDPPSAAEVPAITSHSSYVQRTDI